jgi:hypothetical protein
VGEDYLLIHHLIDLVCLGLDVRDRNARVRLPNDLATVLT